MSTPRASLFAGFRRAVVLSFVSGLGFMASAPVALAGDYSAALDVPYVPTPQSVVDRMLETAQVGPKDFVIDLGSGDGRIAISAVKGFGAKGAMGVDLNPKRIEEANENAKAAGVTDKVEFRNQDLFDTDFSHATVLTMYLLPDVNLALRPKILQLKPGTRVVSHAFDMEEWESDVYERVDNRSVYLWIVPAQVEGRWKIEGPTGALEFDLTQRFQHVRGTAHDAEGRIQPVTGRLRGENIELVVGEGDAAKRYAGSVHGSIMQASSAGSAVKSIGDAAAAAPVVEGWKGARL